MSKKVSKTSQTQRAEPDRASMPAGRNFSAYLIDTTWRIAIPILLFSLGGNWLDNQNETKPLFTLVGLLIGTAGSWLSLRKYLQDNFPDQTNKGAKQ